MSSCFRDHAVFHKALKDAFEVIVNTSLAPPASASASAAVPLPGAVNQPQAGSASSSSAVSIAELMADYCDALLKKGGTKMNERAIMVALEHVVRLFNYLTDKDLFSEFYRKRLASRLLQQRSASTDAEKAMIGKLKMRCGAQFTSKLEGMMNDMENGGDESTAFADFVRDHAISLPCEFTVQTLTSGFWPSYPSDEVRLPAVMANCIEHFQAYYNTKTNNRKLRWLHGLGAVTVGGRFGRHRTDLVASAVQAALLMLFNEATELTVAQIMQHSGLDADNLKRQLRSMASGQFKILLKRPSEGYAPDHRMRVNLNFTSPQRRIRLPAATNKAVAGRDRAAAAESVGEDRKHAIEAGIVRVMKARKTLTHQQLIAEVTQQLMQYFQPDVKAIKKRIEDLIAREYLERDADKSNVYHYLA